MGSEYSGNSNEVPEVAVWEETVTEMLLSFVTTKPKQKQQTGDAQTRPAVDNEQGTREEDGTMPPRGNEQRDISSESRDNSIDVNVNGNINPETCSDYATASSDCPTEDLDKEEETCRVDIAKDEMKASSDYSTVSSDSQIEDIDKEEDIEKDTENDEWKSCIDYLTVASDSQVEKDEVITNEIEGDRVKSCDDNVTALSDNLPDNHEENQTEDVDHCEEDAGKHESMDRLEVNSCSDYATVSESPTEEIEHYEDDTDHDTDTDRVKPSPQHSRRSDSSSGYNLIHSELFPGFHDSPIHTRKDIDVMSEPGYGCNGAHSEAWDSMVSSGDQSLMYDPRMTISCTL